MGLRCDCDAGMEVGGWEKLEWWMWGWEKLEWLLLKRIEQRISAGHYFGSRCLWKMCQGNL
eukprot:403343-Prorocentrum_lima.AAC.1